MSHQVSRGAGRQLTVATDGPARPPPRDAFAAERVARAVLAWSDLRRAAALRLRTGWAAARRPRLCAREREQDSAITRLGNVDENQRRCWAPEEPFMRPRPGETPTSQQLRSGPRSTAWLWRCVRLGADAAATRLHRVADGVHAVAGRRAAGPCESIKGAFKPGPPTSNGSPDDFTAPNAATGHPARDGFKRRRPSRRRKVVRRRGNLLPSGLDAAPRPNVDGDGDGDGEPVDGVRLDEQAGHDHIVVRDGDCGERTHGVLRVRVRAQGAVILPPQIRVKFHHRGSDPRRPAA